MSDKDLIKALRGIAVETGSFVCQGCGYEHECRKYGCAIINKAAARLQVLTDPPNDPLTLDELRGIDGEPVWIVSPDGRWGPCWMVVDVKLELCREVHGGMAVFENYGETWLAYRRKPEGGVVRGTEKKDAGSAGDGAGGEESGSGGGGG